MKYEEDTFLSEAENASNKAAMLAQAEYSDKLRIAYENVFDIEQDAVRMVVKDLRRFGYLDEVLYAPTADINLNDLVNVEGRRAVVQRILQFASIGDTQCQNPYSILIVSPWKNLWTRLFRSKRPARSLPS